MDRLPWIVQEVLKTLSLFPDGARDLFIVLFYLWFSITLVGVFSACISIIKKVWVFR